LLTITKTGSQQNKYKFSILTP